MSGLENPNPIGFKNPVIVLTRTWLFVILMLFGSNAILVGCLVYMINSQKQESIVKWRKPNLSKIRKNQRKIIANQKKILELMR